MSAAPNPGQPVLIVRDLGGFEPGVFLGPSISHGTAWARVQLYRSSARYFEKDEPLSRIVLDTPENRKVAERSAAAFDRGLASIAEAHAVAATLPRLEPIPRIIGTIRRAKS